ncbi:putative multidrug resistance protein E [Trypanosoma cruzi]|uniref:Putative multidrug resistance protein E n=1 Tax=Trypanosoma cruzi TaxID=5693 RepID=A0A2V2UJZ1_TRYCR|nr:putative multidrug resistance protein E [Trypanosoma cruzi]
MISLLGEALVGSSTIKAYGCMASIMKESLRRIDRVCASSFLENATNRWLGVRVDFLGNVIVITIALLGVIGTMMSFSTHDIGLVSLSLTMALASTSQLNWLVRMIGTMGADMNSVERILHYTHNIDHEEVPEMDRLVDELREKNTEGGDVTATVLVEGVSGGSEGQHPETTAGWLEFREWKCGTVRGCRLCWTGSASSLNRVRRSVWWPHRQRQVDAAAHAHADGGHLRW